MYCCSVVVFTAHPEYVTNIGQPIVVEEVTGKREPPNCRAEFWSSGKKLVYVYWSGHEFDPLYLRKYC